MSAVGRWVRSQLTGFLNGIETRRPSGVKTSDIAVDSHHTPFVLVFPIPVTYSIGMVLFRVSAAGLALVWRGGFVLCAVRLLLCLRAGWVCLLCYEQPVN